MRENVQEDVRTTFRVCPVWLLKCSRFVDLFVVPFGGLSDDIPDCRIFHWRTFSGFNMNNNIDRGRHELTYGKQVCIKVIK